MTKPTTRPNNVTHTHVAVGLAAWLAVACVAIMAGIFDDPPKPLIPILVWTPTLLLTFAFYRSERLKRWLRTLDMRILIGFHLIRIFFGVLFLLHLSWGELPRIFAERGGWGDILAGVLAIGALFVWRGAKTGRGGRTFMWVFNVVGLLDILMVFGTAQYVIFSGSIDDLRLLTTFPYALLPLLIVPLVITTHFGIFYKLRVNDGTDSRTVRPGADSIQSEA